MHVCPGCISDCKQAIHARCGVNTYNPSTREDEAGGPQIQGQLELHLKKKKKAIHTWSTV
jgi:hypothetical protein